MGGAHPRTSLSLAERDRRYREVRAELTAGGIGAALLTRSNARYLTGGVPGEMYVVLPAAADLPLTAFLNSRYLSDIPASDLLEGQEWVHDVRPADREALTRRLAELVKDEARIGIDSGLSHQQYSFIVDALPNAELVDVSDVLAGSRSIKSAEELELIERAGVAFKAAIDAVHSFARPAHTGAQVVQEGIRAMWEAGGEMDSTFSLSFGPIPKQNPGIAALCLRRRISRGDMLTMTGHAKVGGYASHSDQELSIGPPTKMHRQMFESVLEVRHEVLERVRPGVRHLELADSYRAAAEASPFMPSPHSQLHQFGIDVPEHPGSRFAPESVSSGKGGRDFVLMPGMVYSISPTLVARNGQDTVLGGTSLVVSEDGYRSLESREVELLVIDT